MVREEVRGRKAEGEEGRTGEYFYSLGWLAMKQHHMEGRRAVTYPFFLLPRNIIKPYIGLLAFFVPCCALAMLSKRMG